MMTDLKKANYEELFILRKENEYLNRKIEALKEATMILLAENDARILNCELAMENAQADMLRRQISIIKELVSSLFIQSAVGGEKPPTAMYGLFYMDKLVKLKNECGIYSTFIMPDTRPNSGEDEV